MVLLDLIGHRTAALALLLALGLPLGAGAAAWGPWSPWAFDRAEACLRAGDPTEALARYQAIARWSPGEAREAEALYRGGLLAAGEAEAPQVAARLLKRLLRQHPDHPRHAEASARLGRVLGRQLADPVAGARLLRQAAEGAPDHPEAASWLLASAALAEEGDALPLAWSALEAVRREHPHRAREAALAMARLRLGAGDADAAAGLYEEVLAEHPEAPWGEVAALGLSISLEDLGDAEGAAAVAELDPADDALTRRREALRERGEARPR